MDCHRLACRRCHFLRLFSPHHFHPETAHLTVVEFYENNLSFIEIFSFENALSFELKAKWPNSIQLNQYIKNTAHKGLCSILFIEFYCSISNEPLWWLAALTPFIHWEKQGDFSSSVIGLIKLVAFVATAAEAIVVCSSLS